MKRYLTAGLLLLSLWLISPNMTYGVVSCTIAILLVQVVVGLVLDIRRQWRGRYARRP